jgi:unsaturated rhamnogalacturonyl hydrolase
MTNAEKIEKAKAVLLSMQRHSWEQGVAAQAFFEIGDPAMGLLLAREAAHRQSTDGRLALTQPNDSLDPGANGGPVLTAFELSGDPFYQQAGARMAHYFLQDAPRRADGILYHTQTGHWTLLDGIYHLAPFLAQAGYPAEAVRQIDGYHRLHFIPARRLYYQAWDDERQTYTRPVCWGGAHGWMAGALARTLRLLPPGMTAERRQLGAWLAELLDGVLPYQRPDGLFHDMLDDSSSFVETTAALMLAYAIYRGVQSGDLDPRYLPAAERMRSAGFERVNELGLVQGAAGAPSFDFPGFSAEAQAFLLLAEAAYQDLDRSSRGAE